MLNQSLIKATETLTVLLDHKDERLKLLTANDIIGHFLKHKEFRDIEERIERIEGRLEASR
ncbi:MAG: hypothetical protein JXA81_00860 [Sedimentisphaerales bacterium]|nr:hypothetical protein [Sedimentisphaerales bacterium]